MANASFTILLPTAINASIYSFLYHYALDTLIFFIAKARQWQDATCEALIQPYCISSSFKTKKGIINTKVEDTTQALYTFLLLAINK